MYRLSIVWFGLVLTATTASAQDAEAIARGKKALATRSFKPGFWTVEAYGKAWEYWTPRQANKPANYDEAFRAYYGLHAAPFAKSRYPMGLRQSSDGKGLTTDCMLCHGGSILGKSYVGLGNATLELQAFYEDMTRASGRPGKLPFTASTVRGTNEAFGMAEFLLSLRDPNLGLLAKPQLWKVQENVCEDAPAWWHLKKKETMYRTGSTNARSVRALMQAMLHPTVPLAEFTKEEPVFRDIQAYLLSLRAPKYPFAIDETLAAQGHQLFSKHCLECHGSYGAQGKYPNRIVPHKRIGTDVVRLRALSPQFIKLYNESWFAKEENLDGKFAVAEGYQAPPLDGIWATAPYFHNGSVPTLYDVLNSKTRPKIFMRTFATNEAAYDKIKVGWRVEELPQAPKNLSGPAARKIYDTTQTGRGNGGHTFGDDLSECERRAVIEYLKTL